MSPMTWKGSCSVTAVAVESTVCRLRQLAIARQEADLERLPALGYVYDEAAADRVVQFIEGHLCHHKGEWAGQPLTLEPWQHDEILRPIFGWRRPDGSRRFRVAYVEIPRKNGKSTLGAAVGLYLTIGDQEAGAETYSAATKKDQAKIVHDAAKAMLKASPTLRRFAKQLRNSIYCERLGSKFEPLGADSSTLDGLNPHGLVIDELHAHSDRHVYDVLQTGTGARRQPLTFIITTAGVYDPASIGWEMHDLAVKVLEGAVQDESFFAYVTSGDEGDDWREPEAWAKANPNLGVSIKEEYLAAECARAQQSPAYENTFKRYHGNIWTQQRDRWIAMDAWNACPDAPVDPEALAGRRCFAAFDLSTTVDMTALALAFPPTEPEGVWDFFWRFYVPAELVAERSRSHRLPDYAAWVRDGWLTTTDGNVIDYAVIRRDVRALARTYRIVELGYDPWNATQIATELQGDGFTLVELRQGYRTLSEPAKAFEGLVRARRVRHGGHPIMRWMVSNVTVRTDPNGNIAPDKSTAAGKIDGVVASIMAVARAIVQPTHRTRWAPVR